MTFMFLFFILGGIGITSILVDSEFFEDYKKSFREKIEEYEKSLKQTLGELPDDEIEKELAEDRRLHWMKKLLYMAYCYQCMGFWVGLILGLLLHPMGDAMPWGWRLIEPIITGGVISYLAQIGMAIYNYLNVYGGKS